MNVDRLYTCWSCGATATTQVEYKGCSACGGAVCGNPTQTLYTCPGCFDRLIDQMGRQAFDKGGPRCTSLRGRLRRVGQTLGRIFNRSQP